MSKSILRAMMAMALALASGTVQAAKPVRGGDRPCLQQSTSLQGDPIADGALIVAIDLKNTCYPTVDMEGAALLLVDGQVVDRAQLGPDDTLQLAAQVPIDGAPHEACVHFEGTAAQRLKGKTVLSPVTHDQCQQLPVAAR